MIIQLVIAAVLVIGVVVIAGVVRRRMVPAPPTQRAGGWTAPAQLDRADFARPDAPWLVVVFSSATCDSCADMVRKATVLASGTVAVQDAEAGAHAELHRRYGIEAVPITVVADGRGVVQASFIGPASATDLWAAVAEVRAPGSSPEPEIGQPRS